MELDRISNLPSDVVNQILSCLTLKEAVRTSVFSSRWRDKWAMLPGLAFREHLLSTTNFATFVSIVDHVLLTHIVPIHNFVLSFGLFTKSGVPSLPPRDIDRWVLHLSRHSIKVFKLYLPDFGPKYQMPFCFFSYQDMIELTLYNCFLKPPSAFKGFKTLKKVVFDEVTLPQDVWENLIFCCPPLESLRIVDCDGFTHLKIDAPNLRYFTFRGKLESVSLQKTVNLSVVRFDLSPNYPRQDCVSSSNLANFFIDLPHIQQLSFLGCAVQYLAVGNLPGGLPKPCLHLQDLFLTVDFNHPAEILTALHLLRSSPVLEVLRMDAVCRKQEEEEEEEDTAIDEANSWLDNLYDNRDCTFLKLRLVRITGFSGCKAELDFIKFMLLNAPVLETMTINASVNVSSEVFKKLLQLRRTSNAEIIYLDLY